MKKQTKIIIIILVIIAIGIIYFFFDYLNPNYKELGQKCVSSGGIVKSDICSCPRGKSFYNNCEVGACSCPSIIIHLIKGCDCGEGKCFDGEKCVEWIRYEQLVSGCAGVQDIYWNECCENWAQENNIVHIQCVGSWTIKDNQCSWECGDEPIDECSLLNETECKQNTVCVAQHVGDVYSKCEHIVY